MEEGVKIIVKEDTGQDSEIALDFRIPDSMVTHFANELAIQAIHTEFIFSFFEVRLPLAHGRSDSPEERLKQINPVCVSRIAISVDRIPAMIEALQKRLDDFTTTRELTQPPEESK